ncbi:DUF6088 family protein [uncultured Bacteroides sp.]|uniref:DUF6088 family protein n=1 Tax=uncultured Bacteroides sp. TaxID=162156 RepID=UPI00280B70EF|nr:DUF6088 family protein [uncultured Bacteroides sp.]
MTIQEQIDARVKAADSGTLFFVNDFCEFDNAYVSKILSLMASYNILERLAKGIYYKPIVTEYGNVYPSAEKIVHAIAEHEHAEILPTGELALNVLGLSTQVPMKPVYLTTGSPRVIVVGRKQIRLKRRTPRMYAYKSKLMPLLELAMKAKGQSNISEGDINRIRELLRDSQEKYLVYGDLGNAPVWIRKIVKQLFKDLNYEFVAK